MPNAIAYLALFLWPLVGFALFGKLSPGRALVWTIAGGYLLLPELKDYMKIDLPLLPAVDKTLVAGLAALLGAALIARARIALPVHPVARALLLLLLLSPVITTLANRDAIVMAGRVVKGLALYDAASVTLTRMVDILPLILGRSLLAGESGRRDLLGILVVAGLLYTLPMLVEIRISPQLHIWFYGFFPHSFAQQMREGGFRPVVFLPHGLWVAFFAATATIAAAALWRAGEGRMKRLGAAITLWLFTVLVLCKSYGALGYALLFVPLVRFAGRRLQLRIALALTIIALLYPTLRAADLVPVQRIADFAASLSAERAQSFQFRIDNEAILLARARERPLTGWGGWGRDRVYDEYTGESLTTSDGRWIIVFGIFGWLGYVAEFGMLALPVLLLALRRGPLPDQETVALAVLLAVNMVELLPNATLTPITWLIAGALLARAEARETDPGARTNDPGSGPDPASPVPPPRPRSVLSG